MRRKHAALGARRPSQRFVRVEVIAQQTREARAVATPMAGTVVVVPQAGELNDADEEDQGREAEHGGETQKHQMVFHE